jgi:hypothetical protein
MNGPGHACPWRFVALVLRRVENIRLQRAQTPKPHPGANDFVSKTRTPAMASFSSTGRPRRPVARSARP